jgi:3-hydroxybutyryl-CoA dehydrogenase
VVIRSESGEKGFHQMQQIRNITVVGAGTMGHGIGQEFASAGFDVVLQARTAATLSKAEEQISRNLHEMSDWGLLPTTEIQPIMNRIRSTTSLGEAVADADLVIESVFEDLELKQRLFSELDDLCQEHTILGSNTSSLMPSSLASVTRRPDRVLNIHFFYPPHLMPLVEIVRGERTSDETIHIAYRTVKAAGKSPIVVQKESLGFLANRLQSALLREALYIVEQGIATAQDVDTAVKTSFGRRLSVAGPIEMVEVQDGWDTTWTINHYILPDLDSSTTPSPVIRERIDRGELGPRTGKGFYEWTDESLQAWMERLTTALAKFLRADQERQRE